MIVSVFGCVSTLGFTFCQLFVGRHLYNLPTPSLEGLEK